MVTRQLTISTSLLLKFKSQKVKLFVSHADYTIHLMTQIPMTELSSVSPFVKKFQWSNGVGVETGSERERHLRSADSSRKPFFFSQTLKQIPLHICLFCDPTSLLLLFWAALPVGGQGQTGSRVGFAKGSTYITHGSLSLLLLWIW